LQKTAVLPSKLCKDCQANKRFSAVNPVICKVSLAGKRFSAVTPIIGKVCQASKQFLHSFRAYLFEKIYK
jgi:hypothetical protein